MRNLIILIYLNTNKYLNNGAGDGNRTHGLVLGKDTLYR